MIIILWVYLISTVAGVSINAILDWLGPMIVAKKRAEKGYMTKFLFDLNFFVEKLSTVTLAMPFINLYHIFIKMSAFMELDNEEFFTAVFLDEEVKAMTPTEQAEYKANPTFNTLKKMTEKLIIDSIQKVEEEDTKNCLSELSKLIENPDCPEQLKQSLKKQQQKLITISQAPRFVFEIEQENSVSFICVSCVSFKSGGATSRNLLRIKFESSFSIQKIIKCRDFLFNDKNNDFMVNILMALFATSSSALTISYEKLCSLKITVFDDYNQIFQRLLEISEEYKGEKASLKISTGISSLPLQLPRKKK